MRITHQSQFDSALRRISLGQAGTAQAEQRLATGKRLDRPSTDPIAMHRALELRATLKVKDQAAANAADGLMWVNLADSKLQTVVERLQRARELAVQGASFGNTNEQQAIATEVAAIRDQAVALANSKHKGRALFAGFSGGDAITDIAGTWTYTGDNGTVDRRIGDNEVMPINVTAADAFGFTSGRDLFSVLDDFEAAALAGSQGGMDTAIGEIDGILTDTLNALTQLGASGRRIEAAQSRHLDEINTVRAQLSELEDMDINEAVLDLKMQETAYQAALAAFGHANRSSLVEFLR